MRIAILITAYKNKDQLERLITHLSNDFDIYVHIDKRSSFSLVSSKKNVKIYKIYRSYWGSLNTVLAVLFLLKEAAKNKYDRYIKITGQDLPIKTNAEIIEFFNNNRNTEFFEYFKLPTNHWHPDGGLDRIQKFWGLEPSKLIGMQKYVYKLVSIILAKIYHSRFRNIFLRSIDYKFFGGSNYMDLTHHCVYEAIVYLNTNPKFIKRFKYTKIPEEIFFQTIFLNLSLKTELSNKILRYIDWESGPDFPKTFMMPDFENLFISDCIFARKFDENIDKMIIDLIYEKVKK